MSLALLLKYWHFAALAALVAFGAFELHERDVANRRAGAAEAMTALVRDSLRSNAGQIRVWDTVYKRDTLRLARLVSRTDTLRDSLLIHKTDTLLVTQYIAKTDSTIKACTETTNDCAKFRVLAESRFNDYEAEIKALKLTGQHWYSDRISLGPYAGIDTHGKGSVGVSAQLALFRFP